MTISSDRPGQHSPGAPPIPPAEQRSAGGSPSGQRLPSASRERKPALAAVAVLLILAGALASALLVIRSGDRITVIAISRPVAAGQQIPLSAMREVQVADTGIATVPWSQRSQVAQYRAKVQLVPGTLLTEKMATGESVLGEGQVVVGLALQPGQFPAQGLSKGVRVRAYAVGGSGGSDSTVSAGSVLAQDAKVYNISTRSGKVSTGTTNVSLVVDAPAAPDLTSMASSGAVAIALLPLNAQSAANTANTGSAPDNSAPGQR